MKSLTLILVSSSVLGLCLMARAQTPEAPVTATAKTTETAAPAAATPAQPLPADSKPESVQSPPADEGATNRTATAEPVAAKPSAPAVKLGPNEVLLNFRNAPIDSVLKYLSDAAGFIINIRTGGDLKGKVTVFSGQPVTRDEAFEQLSAALDQNGYTAIRNGRTLTIYSKEDAKRQDTLPVKVASKPAEIPQTPEMVTQIIPLHYIGAVQVSRDLQPLLPEKATMTANEGGNSVIITDTQSSIHRMAEIISALDTAVSSVSRVSVFPLKFADSKAVASVIKDLFAPQETARAGGNQAGAAANRFLNQFRGGGPGGGGGFPGAGGGGGGAGADASGGRAPTPRVTAVAEERSNSVIVSAPDEQMPIITTLIQQVDINVEDVTELRVFHLHFADAQETADLLTSLFPNTTTSTSNNQGFRGGVQFAGRFGGPFGAFGGGNRGGATTPTADSTRSLKQTQVVAVADLRTGSVVISASHDLMKQIEPMIHELDADPAKKQQVYVFDFQNTDPAQAVSILQTLFPNQSNGGANANTLRNQNQAGTGNQLNTRATQSQNTLNRAGGSGFGTGMGSSGLGGGGSGR